MKLRIGLLLLLLAVAGTAAARDEEALEHAEASMVVTGYVDIAADGTVTGHGIDSRGDLPDFVVELIERQAPGWKFEQYFIDGDPVAARSKMSLRIVAQPIAGSDEYRLSIANGTFSGSYDPQERGLRTDDVRPLSMKAPAYPREMLNRGVRGVVYLLARIGRNGEVDAAVVERVNLRSYGTERDMEDMRRAFANSTLRAARSWRFAPPTTGDYVDDEYWTIRVPVSFEFHGEPDFDAVGHWTLYIPGPRGPLPDWIPETAQKNGSDAMLANQVQMLGAERQLLTPLGG